MIIKIERYFSYPDLKRQTPNCSLEWNEFIFTEDNIDECDYLVILDYPKDDFSIKVNRDNIIHLCLEPPNEVSKYRQFANKNVKLIINQIEIKGNNILSHGALPWHIDKDYDFLINFKPDDLVKKNKIVWVTSNQESSNGHKKRMQFLRSIRELSFIEVYGRGINPIEDKWTVLHDSKYAIAYENCNSDYYWTEKIADCFLSYTMPLYFGCNTISNFFPEKSFIQIDPNDKHIGLFLKEIVESKEWEQNIDAITEARNLVLRKHQLFPFLYDKIKTLEKNKIETSLQKEIIFFKGKEGYFNNYPIDVIFSKNIYKLIRQIKSKINAK